MSFGESKGGSNGILASYSFEEDEKCFDLIFEKGVRGWVPSSSGLGSLAPIWLSSLFCDRLGFLQEWLDGSNPWLPSAS